LTENTETLLESELALTRYAPLGLNATDSGRDPAVKGEPGTSVSAPVNWLTENIETVVVSELAVARYAPLGVNATETGCVGGIPTEKGEPRTSAIAPVDWLTEYIEALLVVLLAVARYPPLGL
jgi:hypothetical protein